MSAAVIPFPRVRNRAFIVRHARRMTEMHQDAGERHLDRLLRDQMEVMRRRGIPEPIVIDEGRAIETAVRVELWRLVLMEGGVA